ncbi:RNA polymerase i specific transcription initiation factor rrn3 superfamily [Colletotrichum karsti]|uniref:RNA polymerase i specific transcription initiation factor rrn3 superfamily n=1 Tax=Colletotrichum karsti TaxID=1095194 RepID=A0A9P6I996_9PEZI|nr:RNA polymerase i specific transcription initiation factor rrn3 superfamily [Colletotrichum karsti]KAF9879207.1 RNA polymerase i specific transcription initiation factor rrn3 superfamily [Colletotrichum karsti]
MRPFTPISRHRSGPPPRTATPIKSILRPSILGRRKADDAGLDSIASDPPSSPTKRRKVCINEMNNSVFEFGSRSMDEVNAEVRKALEEHLMGEDEGYDNLKEIFANDKQRYLPPVVGEDEDTLKPQELKGYVLALTSCVPLLKNKACNGLVRTVLQVSWLGRDEDFFKVYIQFLAALISAQGSYLTHVLSMIVEKFGHSRQSEWSVADFAPVTRSTMRERLHTGLQYLLQMFPAATPVLRSLLDSKFPFDDDPKRMFVAYVNNLLKLSDYAKDLDLDIVDVILSRLVKIDVQMTTDLEDPDDKISKSVVSALGKDFNTGSWEGDEEAEEDDSDDESVDSDDSDFDDHEERVRVAKGNVEKLDAILDTLFDHYTPLFENPDSDEAYDLYALLVQSFGKIVLPTHKCRHTQFLLFHFGQMSARLRDTFVGSLLHIFSSQNRPSFVRQAAATYLAGFMARGAHVPSDLVRTVFHLLLKQMQIYRLKHDPDARGPDLRRHQIYYAQVQAALYMFCFRWRDLIVDVPEYVDRDDPASYLGHELEWMQGMREELSASVYCKMNPLKICAPAIVEEFATLAHKLNLMYIFPRVEDNKRIRLSQFVSDTYGTGGALRDTGAGAQDEDAYQLDPYFPFDPYSLPVSKRWIQSDYVQYEATVGLNATAEDDSDEEEDHIPETDIDEDTATASEDEDDD